MSRKPKLKVYKRKKKMIGRVAMRSGGCATTHLAFTPAAR